MICRIYWLTEPWCQGTAQRSEAPLGSAPGDARAALQEVLWCVYEGACVEKGMLMSALDDHVSSLSHERLSFSEEMYRLR